MPPGHRADRDTVRPRRLRDGAETRRATSWPHAPVWLAKPATDFRIASMALLVGIDEAGYGPHSGPLVVAAAAIEFATPPAPADPFTDPDLWGALDAHIGNGRRGRRIAWSSAIPSWRTPAATCKLERAVLGAMAATGLQPASFAALLDHTAVRSAADGEAAPAPWHRPHALALPRSASPEAVAEAAARLTEALAGLRGASPAFGSTWRRRRG